MSKIVNRTLDFFEAFAQARRPLALSELMKQLDIPVSSCHDVLHALEERGYVYEVRPRGGYYPTARLYNLARVLVDNDPFIARVQPVLEQLRDKAQESVFLMKAREGVLTYVAVIEADTPLRLAVKVGDSVRALHATSAGKAYLASLPPEERDTLLAGLNLKALTAQTITSRTALRKDLQAGEERGWFTNREESVEDSLTVSARFGWHDALYIITVAGSVKRMDRKLEQVVKWLQGAVRELEVPAP
ncbi:MAG TPA: IclR family transcriptional regulator [Ramlibacter sp.]|nr:IclR family transcriptional regulator [Ramlibacter sp.]